MVRRAPLHTCQTSLVWASRTITRRMRDLVLLAQTSDVWQVCKGALRTIHAYEHRAQDDKLDDKKSG